MSLPGYYESDLDAAVEESRQHNRIVTIECDLSAIDDALAYLGAAADNTDSTDTGETVEVYGWRDDAPTDEAMDWRVHLRRVSA